MELSRRPTTIHTFTRARAWWPLLVAATLVHGCLDPLPTAEPDADAGSDVRATFEVAAPTDTGADVWDAWDDALTDAVTLADAVTEDVALADAPTGDVALPDAVTPADDATSTTGDVTDLPEPDTITAGATCSLFASLGCDGGAQCYPDGKTNFCSPAGFLQTGQACVYFNDCVAGNLCVGGLCRSLCDYTGNKAYDCPVGITCDKLNVSGPVGPGIGVCHPASGP